MSSLFRGEARPRRQPVRHHIEMNSAAHRAEDVSDPFPPISNKQFPALYTRSLITRQYHNYMRVKSPYHKGK